MFVCILFNKGTIDLTTASSLIERSRKRKLRELYAVATCDGPIPLPAFLDLNAPIKDATPAERAFLTLNDIKE